MLGIVNAVVDERDRQVRSNLYRIGASAATVVANGFSMDVPRAVRYASLWEPSL